MAGYGQKFGIAGLCLILSGCQDGANFGAGGGGLISGAPGERQVIERDVEAPDVFERTEAALWDGRPSLGGVWIAHPDVDDPERVIIRNLSNGKHVIGALFRRERELPGPRFQVSSDAAVELGILPGAPTGLKVTAMRREEIVIEPEPAPEPEIAAEALGDPAKASPTHGNIDESTLAPLTALAASAIAAAENSASSPRPSPRPGDEPLAASSSTDKAAEADQPVATAKPFIQIGIFSVEANANNTADMLKGAGVNAEVKNSTSAEKTYWRVIVGPLSDTAERAEVLAKIKELGFADAYFVTN